MEIGSGVHFPSSIALQNQGDVSRARRDQKDEANQSRQATNPRISERKLSVITQLDSSSETSHGVLPGQPEHFLKEQNLNMFDGKTKRALSAYSTQQNQPSVEKRELLSSLIGVDYYV